MAADLPAPAEPALDPPAAEEAPGCADGAGDTGRGKARGRADGKLVDATTAGATPAGAAAFVAFLKRDGGSGKAGKAVPTFADDAGVAGATEVAGIMAVGANGAPGAAGAAGACPQSRPAVMAATTARWMRRMFTIGYFLVGALVPVTRDVAAALVEDLGLPADPGAGTAEAPPEALAPGLDSVALEAGPAGAAALGFF